MRIFSLLIALLAPLSARGFAPPHHRAASTSTTTTATFATASSGERATDDVFAAFRHAGAALTLSAAMLLASADPALAADFAKKDISGRDFSGQDLAGKDFTAAKAAGANFGGASLIGASFQKANLSKADFTGANLRGAQLEGAILDGAIFKDVTGQRAKFSESILDIGDLENVDLSDSLWPSKLRIMICDMDELKGENKVTGVDSKKSLMCTGGLDFSN